MQRKESKAWIKDRIFAGIFIVIALVLFSGPVMAIDIDVSGKPLNISGYINQSVQFGVCGGEYDTMAGFQQAIMQALVEVEYYPTNNVKLFTSGLLVKDWAYNILSTDNDWKRKHFDESRSELSIHNRYEDLLKECHITWTPPGFNLRIGKQIVSWGRMDGVRIMDQINPNDRRLGPSDVEFETTIVPIWLAKLEYYPEIKPSFLDEFGIEFTFNPNADFIPDKLPATGGDESGIWAANRLKSLQIINSRIWSIHEDYDEPDQLKDGHEYALRLKGTFPDSTYFTLNFFDGVENSPVIMPDFSKGLILMGHPTGLDFTGMVDDQGNVIVSPYMKGKYANKRFVGFTFSRDFEDVYISWLGGVSPLVRCEAIYEFDSTFTHADFSNPVAPAYNFQKSDAIFWGLGIDWKFKWNLLNERRYFSFVPQFSMRHITDYPSGAGQFLMDASGQTISENNYSFSIRMDTWYLHDKLQPFIYFQRDITQDVDATTQALSPISGSVKSDLWLFRLAYVPNSTWTYKIQYMMTDNEGYEVYKGYDNKDNISFTVQYQF